MRFPFGAQMTFPDEAKALDQPDRSSIFRITICKNPPGTERRKGMFEDSAERFAGKAPPPMIGTQNIAGFVNPGPALAQIDPADGRSIWFDNRPAFVTSAGAIADDVTLGFGYVGVGTTAPEAHYPFVAEKTIRVTGVQGNKRA